MCLGGGGSSKAYDRAEADEAKRKAEISAAQADLESIFSSPKREGQYEDFVSSTRGILQEELDRQQADTSRNLKFANARSGLSGGSADVDSNSRLAQDYLKNIIGAEREAQGAGAGLRSQDQATKMSLFNQIMGGLSATQAATQAANSMSNNVALARSNALQTNIGDLFGNFTTQFKENKKSAADRRAAYDFNSTYAQRPQTIAPVAGVYG